MGLVWLAGCGAGGSSADLTRDQETVGVLVSSLPDRARTPKSAAEQFVDAKPDAALCKRISAHMFVPIAVEIEGDTARVTVKVYNAETSDEVGETAWTAVKRDGQWKLQQAPLP